MPKALPKLGPYTVIPDTNALYSRDPKKMVSVGFEAALRELRKISTVHLSIPEVVLGELEYHKYKLTASALESTAKNKEMIESTTGTKFPSVLSPESAKLKIRQQYRKWCESIEAKKVPANISPHIFSEILNDAIWRNPPFEHSDDGAHEKGFRDRVILETVKQLCKAVSGDVVFLSKDGLLSSSASKCGVTNLTIVPRLEDFASRVRLLKENSEKEWVEELFTAATREFYTEGNNGCIYWRDGIYKRIVEQVVDLTPPENALGPLFTPKTWERQTTEQITLGTTQFQELQGHEWLWTSEVKSAAVFTGKDILDMPHEGIRVSTFAVKWFSKISDTAEIISSRIQSVVLADKQFLTDTAEARSRWSLPAKPIAPPSFDLLSNLGSPKK